MLGAVITFLFARFLEIYLRLRMGAVITFLFARSLEIYLRLRRGISRFLLWLLFNMAAILDSAIVRSPLKWLNAN